MKQFSKRTISFLLALVLLFVSLSASAAAQESGLIHGVLRNGVISDYTYSDEYFSRDSYEYSLDTALISLHFQMAAMQNDNGAGKDIELAKMPDAGIEFLSTLGFDTVKAYGYDVPYSTDSIGCLIGQKNIDSRNETLIALGIRGGNYEWEWGGNLKIGTGEEHEGFSIAKDGVLQYLSDFISNFKSTFNSTVKIWITGFSRSAAVGNLAAAALINGSSGVGYDFDEHNIFAYFFEVPNCTTFAGVKDEKYSCIFNVLNPIDFVPRFVPVAWGYGKYGTDVFIPSAETTENYALLRSKMEKEYNSITNLNYYEDFTFYELNSVSGVVREILNYSSTKKIGLFKANDSIGQGEYLDDLIKLLATKIIKSPENFVENYQGFLMKLLPALIVDSGNFSFTGNAAQIISLLVSFLQKNIVTFFVSPVRFWDGLRRLLAQYLSENMKIKNVYFPEGLTYDDFYKLLGELDDVLLGLLSEPDYAYTTYRFLSSRSPLGDFICFVPHYQEVELAWLRTLAKQEH